VTAWGPAVEGLGSLLACCRGERTFSVPLDLPAPFFPEAMASDTLPGMKSKEIVALRESLGWSLAALGRALGVDTKTVWRWEVGQAAPYPRHQEQLEELRETLSDERADRPGHPSEADAGAGTASG